MNKLILFSLLVILTGCTIQDYELNNGSEIVQEENNSYEIVSSQIQEVNEEEDFSGRVII